MKRKYLFIIVSSAIFLSPVLSFADSSTTLTPKRSGGVESQRSNSNLTSQYFGVDTQGNTSILTPNHSGGYIGVDSEGHPTTITPLRGNLGVDSQGNIWTIRSR